MKDGSKKYIYMAMEEHIEPKIVEPPVSEGAAKDLVKTAPWNEAIQISGKKRKVTWHNNIASDSQKETA